MDQIFSEKNQDIAPLGMSLDFVKTEFAKNNRENTVDFLAGFAHRLQKPLAPSRFHVAAQRRMKVNAFPTASKAMHHFEMKPQP